MTHHFPPMAKLLYVAGWRDLVDRAKDPTYGLKSLHLISRGSSRRYPLYQEAPEWDAALENIKSSYRMGKSKIFFFFLSLSLPHIFLFLLLLFLFLLILLLFFLFLLLFSSAFSLFSTLAFLSSFSRTFSSSLSSFSTSLSHLFYFFFISTTFFIIFFFLSQLLSL